MNAAASRTRTEVSEQQASARALDTSRVVELDSAIRAALSSVRDARPDDHVGQDWSGTLDLVVRASDVLRAAEERVRELEASNRELAERAANQAEALQARILQAQVRADEAEQRRKEAEQWLRRIHGAIVDNLTG